MEEQQIAIRTIQHFMYCPHRWGLLEIGRSWAENVYVVKANLLHERVHDDNSSYVPSKGKKVFTAVKIYNDKPEYGIYGVADCIEGTVDTNGVTVCEGDRKYKLSLIEYKPTKPKNSEYNEDDLMQVFSQKLCLDYVFGCECDGYIYYADVKKRVKLPLNENYKYYDEKLKTMLKEMRDRLVSGEIPAIEKGQRCNGCSMKDMCMPNVKKIESIKKEILRAVEV